MAEAVAVQAGERAAEAAQAAVESAAVQIEAGADAALARAERAEEALETMQDAALRDALHGDIEDLQEGVEQWQQEHGAVHTSLENRLQAMEARCQSLEERLTEAQANIVLVTASIPPRSEEPIPGAPQAEVTAQVIEPGTVAVAPEVRIERAARNLPRWT